MNVSESNALNTLLRWALDLEGYAPSWEEAREAASFLADRSYKALDAGLTGADVELAWPTWCDECGLHEDECWCPPPVEDVVSDLLVDPDGPQTPSEYRRPTPAG